ncbi:hypothetical protein RQP46_006794 [Phenoliferia psychrophenolica]
MREMRLVPTTGSEFFSQDHRDKSFVDSIGTAFSSAQHLPYLFPSVPLSRKSPAVSLAHLPEWPARRKPIRGGVLGTPSLDEIDAIVKELGDNSLKKRFEKGWSLGEHIALSAGRVEEGDWRTLRMCLREVAGAMDNGCVLFHFESSSLAVPILLLQVHTVHSAIPTRSKKNADITEDGPTPIIALNFMLAPVPRIPMQGKVRRLADSFGETTDGRPYAVMPVSCPPGSLRDLQRLLLHNHSLLSDEYIEARKADWTPERKASTSVSFLAPIHGITFKTVARIRTSADDAAAEKICAADGCEKLETPLRCSRCRGPRYCSTEHATSSWLSHKTFCLRSSHPDLFLERARAAGCVLVPLLTTPYFVDGKSVDANFGAMISFQGGGDSKHDTSGDKGLAKNEHGSARFLVKVQKGGRVLIYDEKRTFKIHFGASMIDPKLWNADHEEAFRRLHNEIVACQRWDGLKAFFYATRVGDQLQIDVENLPSQEHNW